MFQFQRYLTIDLPAKQSAFLWGARKTGKSTFLKNTFPGAIYYDLLRSDLFLELSKSPHVLREEVQAAGSKSNLVIIDEVQKIPDLLDEVHWLIENSNFQFILCGSSARKLKRQGVNMLGGRAWKCNFFPLVHAELPEFDLVKIMNRGALPSHYNSQSYLKSLKAYLEDYLTLEIQAEGLVRNLPNFARFIDALRFSIGEMINYSSIARQAHIDAKTVREYFNIVEDTLVGYLIYPFKKQVGRQIITEAPKFYLFDVGIANYIQRQKVTELKGSAAGKSLEQYVLQELIAYRSLTDKNFEVNYWRTKTGLEVDFVLADGEIAIEVTIADKIDKRDWRGLTAFCEEHKPKACYVVSQAPRPRRIDTHACPINILPVKTFLDRLWNHEILT